MPPRVSWAGSSSASSRSRGNPVSHRGVRVRVAFGQCAVFRGDCHSSGYRNYIFDSADLRTLAHTPPFPGGVADWLDSAGLWRRARNRFGFYRHAARGVASAVHSYWSVRDGRSHAFFRLGRQTRLARERNSRWRGPQRDLCDCGGADCVWRVLAAHRGNGRTTSKIRPSLPRR